MKDNLNVREKTQKSVPIKKQTKKIDKDGNDEIVNISHKIKCFDSFRFMLSSLSNLVDNLSGGLQGDKCTDPISSPDYMITKEDQLIFRCFECKKNYKKDFNK